MLTLTNRALSENLAVHIDTYAIYFAQCVRYVDPIIQCVSLSIPHDKILTPHN